MLIAALCSLSAAISALLSRHFCSHTYCDTTGLAQFLFGQLKAAVDAKTLVLAPRVTSVHAVVTGARDRLAERNDKADVRAEVPEDITKAMRVHSHVARRRLNAQSAFLF